jgi:hypothetical protein
VNPHPHDLLTLQDAAERVGTLQGRLRLAADACAPGGIRDALATAADGLDVIDQRLTRAFIDHAPEPERRRRSRAA